ncbi:MAG: cyanophycinase [Candidatus Eremiobacteraeota bacterium]|nr:cyanophycinase [Candidatus Eremiobacteraeota bacterium]
MILLMAALLAGASQQCSVTVFPRYGAYVPSTRLRGPGLVLDGGGALTAPPASLAWMHARLFGDDSRRQGNVVILRASAGEKYYQEFYRDGNFASVQTVLIPPCASRDAIDSVAKIIDGGDALYFSGGDQAHYVAWKGTALMEAAKRLYARGGVVGGGSAGLAIQGAVVFDSVAGDRLNLETTTRDATADPLEPRISFTTGLFTWPPLADTITDTHFVTRNRLGRLVAFLARILHDGVLTPAPTVYGLGVDEASSVVVDPDGVATLLNGEGGRGAYLLRADAAPHLVPGEPLRYTVNVSHVARNGERFDLLRKRTSEPWYPVTVDGTSATYYDRDPY